MGYKKLLLRARRDVCTDKMGCATFPDGGSFWEQEKVEGGGFRGCMQYYDGICVRFLNIGIQEEEISRGI